MENTRKNIITRDYWIRVTHKESGKTVDDAIIPVAVTGESVADCINAARAEGVKVADKYGAGRSCQVLVETASDQGVMLAALQIALRTAKNAVNRSGGSVTQRAILYDLQAAHAAIYAAADPDPVYISDRIAHYCGADAVNYIADAWEGIITARAEGGTVWEQYRAGYKALNARVMQQRAASARECSIEYITDGDGDIVSLSAALGVILGTSSRKYTPIPSPRLSAEESADLSRACSTALGICTDAQKAVIKLLVVGYSQTAAARKLGISRESLRDRLTLTRRKFRTIFDTEYPALAARYLRP